MRIGDIASLRRRRMIMSNEEDVIVFFIEFTKTSS